MPPRTPCASRARIKLAAMETNNTRRQEVHEYASHYCCANVPSDTTIAEMRPYSHTQRTLLTPGRSLGTGSPWPTAT